jgi:16S rRNA (cytidine1402-2'-O)-methyltransferase
MESSPMQPVLYLLPSLLDAEFGLDHLGEKVAKVLGEIRHLVVESERESRRMIRRILPGVDLQVYQTMVLNEHHQEPDYNVYLEPMLKGYSMGLLSDAGCPVLADPGSGLVLEVHRRGWRVEPVSGPSSLLLAWMASGLNGQRMEFHGYLAVKPTERMRDLRELEQRSHRTRQTQVWILRCLKPSTLLCIACELTGGHREWIKTCTVAEWNTLWALGKFPNLHKRPCVFLLQCP